ncbi:MAG: poly-gamma-glutamate system protein [Bacteroidetes bacterium]|nr:poly-gamma-glutamate system protein [Bacteroidota bacterium]
MIKIKAKSNLVLGILSLLSLLSFLAVEQGKSDYKQKWYYEKLSAAKLSKLAADCIKNKRLKNSIFVDEINDPNQTALIGQEYSPITTDHGSIESKLSSTNPNIAAVIVQLLKDAGVKNHDPVAIAMTGSFPGINIATFAAVETLKLNPTIITSVGSSSWGANDPYFTWLDMENVLIQAHLFHHHSIAASIGGSADIGRGLSPEGRIFIRNAINRNHVEFINEEHLDKSIARRMQIYEANHSLQSIKAFINVGGGIASLGNPVNGKLFPAGLTLFIPQGNFPTDGVIIQMGKHNIPVIHLLNINTLIEKYGLPIDPVPLPQPGIGAIFVKKRYSLLVTSIGTFFLIIAIIVVYIGGRYYYRLGNKEIPNQNTDTTNGNESENILVL